MIRFRLDREKIQLLTDDNGAWIQYQDHIAAMEMTKAKLGIEHAEQLDKLGRVVAQLGNAHQDALAARRVVRAQHTALLGLVSWTEDQGEDVADLVWEAIGQGAEIVDEMPDAREDALRLTETFSPDRKRKVEELMEEIDEQVEHAEDLVAAINDHFEGGPVPATIADAIRDAGWTFKAADKYHGLEG